MRWSICARLLSRSIVFYLNLLLDSDGHYQGFSEHVQVSSDRGYCTSSFSLVEQKSLSFKAKKNPEKYRYNDLPVEEYCFKPSKNSKASKP